MISAPPAPTVQCPEGPCFVVDGRGDIDFERSMSGTRRCTLYALGRGHFEAMTVYDAQGRVWRATGAEPVERLAGWKRLLAKTVYNPVVEVRVTWSEPAHAEIGLLARAYERAVKRDDDVLTQFVGAKELIGRVRAAKDFAAMVAVWEWMCADAE